MNSSERGGYSSEQVSQFVQRIRELRNAQPGIQMDLGIGAGVRAGIYCGDAKALWMGITKDSTNGCQPRYLGRRRA
jgi:hypothetical protein